MTITEVAAMLGVSTDNIRRYIKTGKLCAELVTGVIGKEYRMQEIPAQILSLARGGDPSKDQWHGTEYNLEQALQLIRELQDKNIALAAQLGAATERIKNLEMEVKLLSTPPKPWWKRLFGRK